MRETFINLLDKLVVVIVALVLIVAFIGGIGAMFYSSFWAGLAMWIGGAIYAIVIGGGLFLVLAIHDNSKRSAVALEKLANRPAP